MGDQRFDDLRAAVSGPSAGVVARFRGLVAVAAAGDEAPVRHLLELCAASAGEEPGRPLARRLAAWLGGPDGPPGDFRFGTVAAAGGRWAVFLSGDVSLRAGTGTVAVGGEAAAWVDRLVDAMDDAVVLEIDDLPPAPTPPLAALDGLHDLREGVVGGTAVTLGTLPPAASPAAASPAGPAAVAKPEPAAASPGSPPPAGAAQAGGSQPEKSRPPQPPAGPAPSEKIEAGTSWPEVPVGDARPEVEVATPQPGGAAGAVGSSAPAELASVQAPARRGGMPAEDGPALPQEWADSTEVITPSRPAAPVPAAPPPPPAGQRPATRAPRRSARIDGEAAPAARAPLPTGGPPRTTPVSTPRTPGQGRPAAPAEEPTDVETPVDDTPQARGHLCSRGHLNDPRSHFCVLCGIRMNERTGILVLGHRPPLGLLVFDDGATYTVDAEYLVGRMPDGDERVQSGALRSIVVEDTSGSVSRVHAEVRVSGWDVLVVDHGSRNGTHVAPPGVTAWTALATGAAHRLVPGTRVRMGQRTFLFESPSGVR